MVQGEGREEEGGIGDAIDGPDAKAILHGSATVMEEGDEECGGESDEFPTEEECFDGTGGGGKNHACEKEGEEQEEAWKAFVAVEVAAGKGGDDAAEDEGHDDEGHAEPIEDEFECEVEMSGVWFGIRGVSGMVMSSSGRIVDMFGRVIGKPNPVAGGDGNKATVGAQHNRKDRKSSCETDNNGDRSEPRGEAF